MFSARRRILAMVLVGAARADALGLGAREHPRIATGLHALAAVSWSPAASSSNRARMTSTPMRQGPQRPQDSSWMSARYLRARSTAQTSPFSTTPRQEMTALMSDMSGCWRRSCTSAAEGPPYLSLRAATGSLTVAGCLGHPAEPPRECCLEQGTNGGGRLSAAAPQVTHFGALDDNPSRVARARRMMTPTLWSGILRAPLERRRGRT